MHGGDACLDRIAHSLAQSCSSPTGTHAKARGLPWSGSSSRRETVEATICFAAVSVAATGAAPGEECAHWTRHDLLEHLLRQRRGDSRVSLKVSRIPCARTCRRRQLQPIQNPTACPCETLYSCPGLTPWCAPVVDGILKPPSTPGDTVRRPGSRGQPCWPCNSESSRM